MINIKHVMDPPEQADGVRLWVEPIGLTNDLVEWCRIDAALTDATPPMEVWEWFEDHQIDYDEFRGRYHLALQCDRLRPDLEAFIQASRQRDYTLLHQGLDPEHNTATALYEFLTDLSAYCPP